MAFNFEDELGGMDDAALMDVLGITPTGAPAQKSLPPVQPAAPSGGFLNATPAPSPFISASAPSPSVVGAPMAAPAPSPFVSPFSARLEPDQPQPMLYGWEARKEEPPQSVLDQLRALQSQQTSPQIPSSAGVTFVPEGSEPPTIAVGRTEQPPSFDDLMSYVMSGQPTMKAVSAPAPVSSSVPAYAPAPSPVYTQAPAASPAPTPFAAPSPMNLFGMDVTQDQLADLGVSAPAAPAPSPVQAPAPSTAAQAPATPTKYGYWKTVDYGGMGGEGGGQGYSQTEWVSTPDLASQYENVANYKPYEGSIDPKAFSWAKPAKSGADIYGIWNFDTKSGRETASEEYARSVANPIVTNVETGESYTPSVPVVSNPFTTTDKEGNATLDPSYGLKDVSGLVHGTMKAPSKDGKYITTYSAFFDPKTGKQVGNYATRDEKIQRDVWGDLLFSAALAAIAGPLGGALGGGALGAGLAGAALGGSQASVAGGDVLKGALTGGLGAGLGNVASGYINPLAAEAAKQVGGGTLGDIVSGAVKGAGTSATGALVGGKSIGDALLSGALGGGASAGIGSLVGQTGLPPELAKIAAPALTAAVLGKDPASAALNAAIGQVIGAAKTGGGAEAGAMIAGEADERKGVSEVADLLSKSVTGQGSLEDLEQMYAAEGDRAGTTAAIDALTKGADTAAGVSGEDLTAGASDQTVQDLLDAGLISADTGVASLINELVGNKPGSLSEQAKFLESNVEDADDIDKLLRDYAVDTGQIEGGYAGLGGLGEDFYVTDRGTVKSTYSGEEGNFDENGNWVPYTGGTGGVSGTSGTGGKGGTGGGTSTKTTTTTTPTGAKSGLDLNSLMAWMALAGGEEQARTPQQELFNLGQRKSLQDIFKNYFA